ncbi:hypothetical protein SISSUDRAFT_1044910 [Sistotremastrum suecicum HHB10207 ss-3]|uniref:Fungal-type protein kinase domain-containing protein n=1 Tax=Sistotremastrum suecicum HHB10207 ss-3 TaxID=1314776 RepID=A0A166ETY6_9AGAM|nr:hypothetical protein SISSUDRAFT_1044910 [Sistotremastrum suecicum HHB10207 ss-3]
MSSALLRGCPNLRGQSMVHDDLESFLWVLIVTALWIEDPSPSSEEYDKWVNSAEWAMKTTLFPVIGIPSTSWLSEQKRALLFSFSGKGNPYNSFAPYDPVSRLYSRVIEPWSDYMFRRDLEGMTSKNQTPTDEQYYLAILEILRNGIKSFS